MKKSFFICKYISTHIWLFLLLLFLKYIEINEFKGGFNKVKFFLVPFLTRGDDQITKIFFPLDFYTFENFLIVLFPFHEKKESV